MILTEIRNWSFVMMKAPPEPASATARDTILDAAESLLGRYGYRKTTMDDIAREARIGKGTTYLHFRSKEEVFLTTIDRIVDRLCERLRLIAVGPGTLNERLEAMLVDRVLYRFDCVSHYPASLDEIFASLRLSYLERRGRNLEKESAVFEAALLGSSSSTGELIPDARDAAEALLESTNSLLPYGLSPRELGNRNDVERRARRIAAIVVAGVLSSPTSVPKPAAGRRNPTT
jgi:AcrR family transcriptional regulator